MKQYKSFYEDDIWLEAYELQKIVFELSKKFPSDEKYSLKSQINSSSNSVMANLAESHGRYHFADKIRVLYIVRGEIEETQSHLICAVGRGYLVKEETTLIIKRYEILEKRLNGQISDFIKKKNNNDH